MYYKLVLDSRITIDGISTVPAGCLIALKARAWLDLSGRKAAGEANVADVDIKKHRNDVFSGLLGQFSIGNTPDLEYANHHA